MSALSLWPSGADLYVSMASVLLYLSRITRIFSLADLTASALNNSARSLTSMSLAGGPEALLACADPARPSQPTIRAGSTNQRTCASMGASLLGLRGRAMAPVGADFTLRLDLSSLGELIWAGRP